MYKVIKTFADLQDNDFRYNAGDIYPRKGLKVSSERLEELSTDKNKQHKPLIEKVIEEAEEKSKPEATITEDTGEIEEKPKRRNRKKENDAGTNS